MNYIFHNVSRAAILHLDADSFFASCEQAINPKYRGKPVITGAERGIVAAASCEAKKLGITRGVALADVRRLCPDAIILPSDYETYSLFSKRMFAIIRRFTPQVEEYSIDEAFADLTGLRRPLHMSYVRIAAQIKAQIEAELGITVSVGLAPSKVLAKIASKYKKPSGLTVIGRRDIARILRQIKIGSVWGIGPQTTAFLTKHGVKTAFAFAIKQFDWVKQNLAKPGKEIWRELNGEQVYEIVTVEKDDYVTISKTKTFTPASREATFVFAQLVKNIENAFIKVRRHTLAARGMMVFLKQQDFTSQGLEIKFSRATGFPDEVLILAESMFVKLFKPGQLYRATGVVLFNLQPAGMVQPTLFENPLKLDNLIKVYAGIDKLSQKYGKHTLFLAPSLPAHKNPQHYNNRGQIPVAKQLRQNQLYGRKFINLPWLLGEVT